MRFDCQLTARVMARVMTRTAATMALCALALAAPAARAVEPTLTEAYIHDALRTGPDQSASLRVHLWPAATDIGRPIRIFAVAQPTAGTPTYALADQGWIDITAAPIPPIGAAITAGPSHAIDIVRDADLRAHIGTRLWVGYGIDSGGDSAREDMLRRGTWRQVAQLRSLAAPLPRVPASVASCPSDLAQPRLGTAPIALDGFIAMRPLGFQTASVHVFPAKHGAFSMTPLGATAKPLPVRAPTQATVTDVIAVTGSTGARSYQVFLHPCRALRLYFGHLVTIEPRLEAALGTPSRCNANGEGSARVTTCWHEGLEVAFAEGEVFGTGPDSAGVDFGLLDFRRAPAAFVMPVHYDAYYPYYAAPLEYFQPGVAEQLAARSGSVLGARRRTAAPIGGSYMQDLPGTAQGNWSLPGRYWADATSTTSLLAFSHDYVDPTQPLIALGGALPGMPVALYSYAVREQGSINRDPSAMSEQGHLYCLQGFVGGQTAGEMPLGQSSGVLLLMPVNELGLWVEYRDVADCSGATTLSAAARLYVR